MCIRDRNMIRDGGSTALYAVYTIGTVDIVYTVDMVYIVDTVYAVDTVYMICFTLLKM